MHSVEFKQCRANDDTVWFGSFIVRMLSVRGQAADRLVATKGGSIYSLGNSDTRDKDSNGCIQKPEQ